MILAILVEVTITERIPADLGLNPQQPPKVQRANQ